MMTKCLPHQKLQNVVFQMSKVIYFLFKGYLNSKHIFQHSGLEKCKINLQGAKTDSTNILEFTHPNEYCMFLLQVENLGSSKVIILTLPLLKAFWELFFWSCQFMTHPEILFHYLTLLLQ